MIKNTIIIILILLLVITLYSYYCLSSSMMDYERKRMEYIVNKEQELIHREQTLNSNINYKNQLDKCNIDIDSIKNALGVSNLPTNNKTNKKVTFQETNTNHCVKIESENQMESSQTDSNQTESENQTGIDLVVGDDNQIESFYNNSIYNYLKNN